jgi:hypothetical protein
MKQETCPRCGVEELHQIQVYNALSRTTRQAEDTPVYVCSPCGTDEAMEDWLKKHTGGATPQDQWPLGGFALPALVEVTQRSIDIAITEQMDEQF